MKLQLDLLAFLPIICLLSVGNAAETNITDVVDDDGGASKQATGVMVLYEGNCPDCQVWNEAWSKRLVRGCAILFLFTFRICSSSQNTVCTLDWAGAPESWNFQEFDPCENDETRQGNLFIERSQLQR